MGLQFSYDSFDQASIKFSKQQQTIEDNAGYGSTAGAQALAQKHLEATKDIVLAQADLLKVGKQPAGTKELLAALDGLDPFLIALGFMTAALTTIGLSEHLRNTTDRCVRMLQHETFAATFRAEAPEEALKAEKAAKRRRAMKYRRADAKAAAALKGILLKRWTGDLARAAREFSANVLLATGLFDLIPAGDGITAPYLQLTAESSAFVGEVFRRGAELSPVNLPSLEPLPKWEGFDLTIKTSKRPYKLPLVRSHGDRFVMRAVREALKNGTMQPVLDNLNNLQSVAWRVNTRILEVIKWVYASDIEIEGFPKVTDFALPEMPDDFETLPEPTKHYLRGRRGRMKQINRALGGKRVTYDADMAISDHIVANGNRFWTPYNYDYRARTYTACYFGYQRLDYVRGLFLFDQGELITDEGVEWLKVHVANTGDFGKISKKSFDKRIAWVDDNFAQLISVGYDPAGTIDYWKTADAPFQFLAACIELANWWTAFTDGRGYVCHLPIGFDGSCSGLQHLSAMTRAEEGALVNLTPSEEPNDVYQTVANLSKTSAEAIAAGDDLETAEIAQKALIYGVDRSLMKRSVMTYSYSSKAFGMAEQFMEDTMKPLEDQVVSGELPVHPFEVPGDTKTFENGNVLRQPGKKASLFLGKLAYSTIERVVHKPAEAMRFLQKLSRAPSHEGKPVIWNTPLGFPVVLHCAVKEETRITLWLHDRGVKRRTDMVMFQDTDKIDKNKAASGIAPSFVHSMDGCHLQMVVNACAKEGIEMAVVHDSFGCLPSQASRMRTILKEQFYSLYAFNDVLADILKVTSERLENSHDKLPELPVKGSLDLTQILNAEYAFA